MHPTVKVFVGNVPEETSQAELRDLFEAAGPGQVLKVALMKQFAFVHMRDEASADRAIAHLNGHLVHGQRVVVEHSRPRPTHTVKIFVGNVSAACTSGELRTLFQEYGPVVECDIVKDYAFVHMEKEEDARAAIEHLNGREVKGKRINVELSNKAHKKGPAGERIPVVNENLRSANLGFQVAAPATAYSSLEYEYQRLGNTSLTQEAQARQMSPSYFARDRSPIRRSPPRAGYAVPMTAQQPSYRDQPSASLGMAYRAQPAAVAAQAAQAAMYSRAQSSALLSNTYRAQSSLPLGTSGAQAGASALTSYNAQVAAYGAQAAASQVPSYEAQTTTSSYAAAAAAYGAQAAASYAASYGAQAAAQLASYSAQPAASQAALYSAQALSAQAASYGAQPATGHATSYGAQATASALPAAYGAQSAASLAAAYNMQDMAAASYKTQLSASLPAAYRTPAEVAYTAQQSAVSSPLAASYRAQSAYNGLTQSTQQMAPSSAMLQSEAASLHPPYERTRLSPPRSSREDLYRKAAAMNKRYSSDLSEDRRLSDLSDYRRLADSPNAYRHSPTKGQLDYRRLPEMQSDYARYAGAYGDYLRSAQLQLHANYQRRL